MATFTAQAVSSRETDDKITINAVSISEKNLHQWHFSVLKWVIQGRSWWAGSVLFRLMRANEQKFGRESCRERVASPV